MLRTILLIGVISLSGVLPSANAAERQRVSIKSSVDCTEQPCYVILPDNLADATTGVPLLVSLHSWSADLEQRNRELEEATTERGWIYLFPNFRGANRHPDACGSVKAQQDILDATDWAQKNLPVDPGRIYLTGISGGGHMTMLMAARHPKRWTAASAWVGISDLTAWYDRHRDGKYGAMMRQVFGDAPDAGPAIEQAYRARSPLTYLHQAVGLPLDIAAGVHDGHTGSVPIRHSLDAFNKIAGAAGSPLISEREIAQLSRKNGSLAAPQASDQQADAEYGRSIYLRRHCGPARVTIFEGGHEGLTEPTMGWFERHKGR